jgi:hypothetical protein
MLSLLKVEKVVKPPQKPVVSSRHKGCDAEYCLLNHANSNPKRKHPNRLTIHVPHGNPCAPSDFMNKDMPYLNAPPKKLPIPTINKDFIMMQNCVQR